MNIDKAIEIAKKVRLNACAENYFVGACLVSKSGNYYSGCNIENNGIQSICAERTAFVKALSEGEKEFDYIVVVGAPKNSTSLDTCLPCGYCRQFMSEYANKDFRIYCYSENAISEYSINDLLPHAFEF